MISSVQPSSSVVSDSATPWNAVSQASLSITNSLSLLKLMFIDSVILSNHLIFCCPLLLPSIFPRIRVLSNESVLCIRWPKYWSFSFSISLPKEYSGLISLGLTGLISMQSKGLSRVFFNTTVQKHQFFGAQLSLWSNSHIYTGKTLALTRLTFVGKIMSLLFNTLSRLVIAFSPRSSFFSKSFNFMATVTICSDFGAQENKACHSFHCFPIDLP